VDFAGKLDHRSDTECQGRLAIGLAIGLTVGLAIRLAMDFGERIGPKEQPCTKCFAKPLTSGRSEKGIC
jgi:hypothetical protein